MPPRRCKVVSRPCLYVKALDHAATATRYITAWRHVQVVMGPRMPRVILYQNVDPLFGYMRPDDRWIFVSLSMRDLMWTDVSGNT